MTKESVVSLNRLFLNRKFNVADEVSAIVLYLEKEGLAITPGQRSVDVIG